MKNKIITALLLCATVAQTFLLSSCSEDDTGLSDSRPTQLRLYLKKQLPPGKMTDSTLPTTFRIKIITVRTL